MIQIPPTNAPTSKIYLAAMSRQTRSSSPCCSCHRLPCGPPDAADRFNVETEAMQRADHKRARRQFMLNQRMIFGPVLGANHRTIALDDRRELVDAIGGFAGLTQHFMSAGIPDVI